MKSPNQTKKNNKNDFQLLIESAKEYTLNKNDYVNKSPQHLMMSFVVEF